VAGDASAGLAISPDWKKTLLVAGTVMQNVTGDHLQMYELAFDHSWITATPSSGTIPGGEAQEITVSLNPEGLPDGYYPCDIRIFSEILGTSVPMPVVFAVALAVGDQPASALPKVYLLAQNYPKPFNPTTTIHYELKTEGLTRLRIYNLMGQTVAELVNSRQPAGAYSISFNAANLPSGMYFYRLESGDFVATHKMILMK